MIQMSLASATPASSVREKRRIDWLEICLGLTLLTLLAQVSPDILRVWREWPTPGRQTPGHAVLKTPDAIRYETKYLLYLPQAYASKKSWPLLLYLHGAGERGEDPSQLERQGPCHYISQGYGLPLIVLAPQCPKDQCWNSEQLLALLDCAEVEFNVDKDRVYVGGFSMGGRGTWELAAAAPDRFAAILPVAGTGNVEDAEKLKNLPLWAFHGDQDQIVPFQGSTEIIKAIKAHGGRPKLTVFEHTGHGIGNHVFSRTDVYQWLLRHKRGGPSQERQLAVPEKNAESKSAESSGATSANTRLQPSEKFGVKR
jgi:poly(3-hydroxybutyrate) depolymerase